MVFESDPEKRINVGQLKQLIFQCSHFSAPAQQLPPSPPQSPRSIDDLSSISSNGSVDSSDSYGSQPSLGSSRSSLSDGSDFSVDSPMELEPDFRSDVPVTNNAPAQRQVPQPNLQQYVLPSHQPFPSQFFASPAKQNPCDQPWIYDHPYEQVHPMAPLQPVFHPYYHGQY